MQFAPDSSLHRWSVRRALLLGFGASQPLSFDLQSPVLFSGPAGMGKETLASLLTQWYHPHPGPWEAASEPSFLVYEWKTGKQAFCSFHSVEKQGWQAFVVEGPLHPSWEQETTVSTLAGWRTLLLAEGKGAGQLLPTPESWLQWLCGEGKPAKGKQRDRQPPSPALDLHWLRALRFRPNPDPRDWNLWLSREIKAIWSLPHSIAEAAESYLPTRKGLLRLEHEASNLASIRQAMAANQHLAQERELLLAHWPAVAALHLRQQHELNRQLQLCHQPSAQVALHERLALRLGWLEWSLSQEHAMQTATAVAGPRDWWEARKLLQGELDLCRNQLDNLLLTAFQSLPKSSGEEEEIIVNLELLEAQKPDKWKELEAAKWQLEWLRREKETESSRLTSSQEAHWEQLQATRVQLEAAVHELEAESRRPPNTLRHWLDKHVPDWTLGPGKLLSPDVLQSRGMFPQLERINDLFFGIRLHLDDLTEPQLANTPSLAEAETRLEALRKEIAAFHVRCQHEEKLLQTRYRQKTRPLQVAIQQAEYNLQQHERTIAALQARLRRLQAGQQQARERHLLDVRFQAEELQAHLEGLRSELQLLDQSWEAWIATEETQGDAWPSRHHLRDQWREAYLHSQQRLDETKQKAEVRQAELETQLAEWKALDQYLQVWMRQGILPTPRPGKEPKALSLMDPDVWIKRFQVLIQEEKSASLAWSLCEQQQPWLKLAEGRLEDELDLREPEALAQARSELAEDWLPRLLALQSECQDALQGLMAIETGWRKWDSTFEAMTKGTEWQGLSPQASIRDSKLVRALEAILQFCYDNNGVMQGVGLFSTRQPKQLGTQTLSLLDNLGQAWQEWMAGKDSLSLGQGLMALASPRPDLAALHGCLHLAYLMTASPVLPGPVLLPSADQVPHRLFENLTQQPCLVAQSVWPLPVTGQHVWVAAEKGKARWEALPFAVAAGG